MRPDGADAAASEQPGSVTHFIQEERAPEGSREVTSVTLLTDSGFPTEAHESGTPSSPT